MKRPRGVGRRLAPTNMIILIFVLNFYMEMYTYTTNYWLAFHLIIEGYKEGSRIGSLFGNSKGAVRERRNGGNGEHGPDLAARRTGRRRLPYGHGHEQTRLARRQGWNGRCHGQTSKVAIDVGKEVG
jgi:hypothetical protein